MAAAGLARLVLGLGTVGARGAVSGPLSCWAGPGRASRRLFSNRNILVELEEGVGERCPRRAQTSPWTLIC